MAITAYNILSGTSPADLTNKVTAAIADGWTPLGSPYRTAMSNNTLQAMVQGSADGGSSTEYTLPAATATALGGVMEAAYVANTGTSTATDAAGAVTDLNTLATNVNKILANLQAAGIMASS